MCESHRPRAVGRRSLLRAGAASVAVAPLLRFEPAAAGQVRSQTFSGEFTTPATADWHHLPFEVPRGVRNLHVAYEYTPTDTGAGVSYNVVDLGVFDPSGHDLGNSDGFRGWSGGARREFEITAGSATPGYLAGALTPGVWHLLLGPYQIVPPGTRWRAVVTVTFGRPGPAFVPSPAPASVPGTGPAWYRGDLHLHTVHSDGKRTQRQLLEAAREAGLDFLGSSDHNTSSASYTWGRYVPEGFLVINGEEVTTRSGHWLAMGLPAGAWIDWRYRAEDDELGRFTDRVHELGGIAIVAHPYNPVPSIRWGHGFDYAGMDAIEAWNGPWTGDDATTVTHWHSRLVEGEYLPIVGNSDSHTPSQAVGLAQTVYRLETLSTAAVLDAIRGGHAWIAESAAVDLAFTASLGEQVAECGDHLGAAPEDLVTVRLVVSGVAGSLARVLGPAGVLGFGVADDAGTVTVETTVPAGLTRFVRAEVGRPKGDVVSPAEGTPIDKMAALTNPIFLT